MYTFLGSDPRRYYIGRLVMAVTGEVTTTASFQVMLRYSVNLYVPRVVLLGPGPTPGVTYVLPSAIDGADQDTGTEPSLICSAPVPAIGRYILPDNMKTSMFIAGSEGTVITTPIDVIGFEVTSTVLQWGPGTRYIPASAPNTSVPWPQGGGDAPAEGDWLVLTAQGGDPSFVRQRLFAAGTIFEYTTV